jgi:Cof subfamily protein (haloacid dehalogenase superfamily)
MSRRSAARETAPARETVPARETAPAFPTRLVALDIDGTLVGDDLLLRERTRVAIRAAIERGVSVSIVTGRMATSALGFARDLGIRDPIVGYQGALIRAVPPPGTERLGKLLLHRPLAAAAAREVIEWTRQIGLDPHVNHLERFIIRADDPRADDYSAFLGGRAVLVDDLLVWLRRPVSKIIAVSDTPIDASVLDVARERFAGRADVTISHPRFLEFLRPGVSKGAAVRWLARRAGVPLANVLAIGDQFNDLEMIATAGHGAAMPHAPAPVRSAARYVAEPLEDEGAARLIEDLVLAEPSAAARHAARLARMTAGGRAGIEARPGTELGAMA